MEIKLITYWHELSDDELQQRFIEERAVVGLMLQLGYARRAKEASDRITEINREMARRENVSISRIM